MANARCVAGVGHGVGHGSTWAWIVSVSLPYRGRHDTRHVHGGDSGTDGMVSRHTGQALPTRRPPERAAPLSAAPSRPPKRRPRRVRHSPTPWRRPEPKPENEGSGRNVRSHGRLGSAGTGGEVQPAIRSQVERTGALASKRWRIKLAVSPRNLTKLLQFQRI